MLTPQTKRWIDTVGAQTDWPEDFATRKHVYTQEFSARPVPRLGRAEEVAAAVAFLAGPLGVHNRRGATGGRRQ